MVKFRVLKRIPACLLTTIICMHTIAQADTTAKSSLSADQHFAEAKKLIDAQSGEGTPRRLVDGAISHLDQALAEGYSDQKDARWQLHGQLRNLHVMIGSAVCNKRNKKYSQEPVVQERCKRDDETAKQAGERSIKVLTELYRDYPDDLKVILAFSSYRESAGAGGKEVRIMMQRAAKIAPKDAEVLMRLAGMAVTNERQSLYADAVTYTREDVIIVHNINYIWGSMQRNKCAKSPEIDAVVAALPPRFSDEAGTSAVDMNNKVERQEFVTDQKKLYSLRDRFVTLLRAHDCQWSTQ